MAYSNITNNSIMSSEKLHYFAQQFIEAFMVASRLVTNSQSYRRDENIKTVKMFCQSFEEKINSIDADDLKAIFKQSPSFKALKNFICNERLDDKQTLFTEKIIQNFVPLIKDFCLYAKRTVYLYFLPYDLLEPFDALTKSRRAKSSKPLGNVKNFKKILQSIYKKNEWSNWEAHNYDSIITVNLIYSLYKEQTEKFSKDFLINLYEYHYVTAFLRSMVMLNQAELLKENYFNIIADTFKSNEKDNIAFIANPIIFANIIITLDKAGLIDKIDLSNFFYSNRINPVFSASIEALAQAGKLNKKNLQLIMQNPTLSFYFSYTLDTMTTKNKHSQADLNKLSWFMMVTHDNRLFAVDLCRIINDIKYNDVSIFIPPSIALIIINCLELKEIGLYGEASDNGFIDNEYMLAINQPTHSFYQYMSPPAIMGPDQEEWIIELKNKAKWRAILDAHYYFWGLIDNAAIHQLRSSIINKLSNNDKPEELLDIIIKRHKFYHYFTTLNNQEKINYMIMEIPLIIDLYNKSPKSFNKKLIYSRNFIKICKKIISPPQRKIDLSNDSNASTKEICYAINKNNSEENPNQLAVEEFINLHKKEQHYFKWNFFFFTISLRKHFFSYWKSNYENVTIDKIVNLSIGNYSKPRWCFFGASNSGATSRDVLKQANIDIDELRKEDKTDEERKQMVITGLLSHRISG